MKFRLDTFLGLRKRTCPDKRGHLVTLGILSLDLPTPFTSLCMTFLLDIYLEFGFTFDIASVSGIVTWCLDLPDIHVYWLLNSNCPVFWFCIAFAGFNLQLSNKTYWSILQSICLYFMCAILAVLTCMETRDVLTALWHTGHSEPHWWAKPATTTADLSGKPASSVSISTSIAAQTAYTLIHVLAKPSIYSGDLETCKGFLLQCKMYFAAHLNLMEPSKFTIFMNCLCHISDMYLIIQQMERKSAINHSLFTRVLGRFPNMPSNSVYSWPKANGIKSHYLYFAKDLRKKFSNSLHVEIKLSHSIPSSTLAISLVNVSRDCNSAAFSQSLVKTKPMSEWFTEPMQLGRTRLSSLERERRRIHGLCFYCRSDTHKLSICWTQTSLQPEVKPSFLIIILLYWKPWSCI